MKITQAYEILSDAERRSLYDDYGTTSEPRQGHGGSNGFQRQSYDDFFRDFDGFHESFFGGHAGGFKFHNFANAGREHSRKNNEEEITKKIYDETVFPQSYTKPFMIFFYTEFCFSCMSVDNVWQAFKPEIKLIGFGAGHSDASWNRELAKVLGITTVPSIVGVLDGKIFRFRGEYTVKNLREFARRLIPQKLVTHLDNVASFNLTLHETLGDNRVFALFISQSNNQVNHVSLRFKMPCFQLASFIKCAYINAKKSDQTFPSSLKKHFNILILDDFNREKLFILKESEPINLVTTQSSFTSSDIFDFLAANKFLDLPRLSSMAHFFDICPPENLCVILIANSATQKPSFLFEAKLKEKLLKQINNEAYLKQSARLTYVYSNVQTDFVDKLLKSLKTQSFKDANLSWLEKRVFILKRVSEKHALLNWFEMKDDDDLNELVDRMRTYVKNVFSEKLRLDYKMTTPLFYHESSQV